MPYVEGRVVHDADAHVMETPEWLDEFASPQITSYLRRNFDLGDVDAAIAEVQRSRRLHADPGYAAAAATEIMLRKNWRATGAFVAEDRRAALDHMGFASQLIFPTVLNVVLENLEHGDDEQLIYEMASAGNRSLAAFCADDPRLLAVGYVPLARLDRAADAAREAIEVGCKALLIPNRCPRDHAPSHIALDSVWAQAQQAGLPILMHVATPDLVMPAQHRNNGLPIEPDFHGGSENFRSVSYMAIPSAPMQTLSMLIFDGVLERFPELRFGVIELGAAWVPSFMRQLDAAMDAFRRHEGRLQKLSQRPSDYVRRQVRVTPYPTEPTRWIIENSGPDICLFSSDYPHVEGGRNPLRRFDSEVSGLTPEVADRFFRGNFEDLMGAGLKDLVNG